MTKTGNAQDERTIYVDDPEGKKFYEMRDHDAMLLLEGDMLVRKETLLFVKNVKKKRQRKSRGDDDGGLSWTVTLSDGFQFDPRAREIVGVEDSPRSMTFWRPRSGF